jgi:hypothetical protein
MIRIHADGIVAPMANHSARLSSFGDYPRDTGSDAHLAANAHFAVAPFPLAFAQPRPAFIGTATIGLFPEPLNVNWRQDDGCSFNHGLTLLSLGCTTEVAGHAAIFRHEEQLQSIA